ncbi:hypothetical protein M2139_001512 [Enterococcus sp. PF1-24]|uniref:hypothetical protein n=1 Tax=unclassified Enterococcus TaxID=2608891 RepID=UPI002474BE20|nr:MULTISPECIES: hypothetical protein [unclassified Enterococcus]MDH6364497.1 hypothetical protein [Enterococcus sp. PFB1-1]MDH6401626.1 hypothetical protein [Enterococcus sp. PF1-24]
MGTKRKVFVIAMRGIFLFLVIFLFAHSTEKTSDIFDLSNEPIILPAKLMFRYIPYNGNYEYTVTFNAPTDIGECEILYSEYMDDDSDIFLEDVREIPKKVREDNIIAGEVTIENKADSTSVIFTLDKELDYKNACVYMSISADEKEPNMTKQKEIEIRVKKFINDWNHRRLKFGLF